MRSGADSQRQRWKKARAEWTHHPARIRQEQPLDSAPPEAGINEKHSDEQMHSSISSVRSSQNLKKQPRFSSRKILASKPQLYFPAVGKCLSQKLKSRPYSGYFISCPTCDAPRLRKCVGLSGIVLPICHIGRDRLAAELYRSKIRQRSGLPLGNGGAQ
jgi:hypothetical protein